MITVFIHVIILLIVLGLLLWCIQRIPGIPAPIPVVLQILVVLAFAVAILQYYPEMGLR